MMNWLAWIVEQFLIQTVMFVLLTNAEANLKYIVCEYIDYAEFPPYREKWEIRDIC